MLPVKGHNSNNPCWTPAKKDPKLPDPKDISNPSLLKALDAVVAAGRCGLLGPEGMVAAAAIPEQNLDSSNGMVSQQLQNIIPRVMKKKPRIEKPRTVITVVQSTMDPRESGWMLENKLKLNPAKMY
ncbi:uncharacterized protein LOC134394696 isoform X2 [Elgaria multicarinata webbii]|uniref:uncharacterized protein LOC134394696 isoform X2 n=1 Tax=Elgaria multicarinata webbii TaxID=159646 RepID=UPI002FCD2E29